MGQFGGGQCSVQQDVVVVFLRECRVGGIVPAFGIVMEAEDEVGTEGEVDAAGASSDFAGEVEKFLLIAEDGGFVGFTQ